MSSAGSPPSTKRVATAEAQQAGTPSRIALIAAGAALVIWLAFAVYLLTQSGANDAKWGRIVWVFASVEAVAFAAAGVLFGTTVNRQRAEVAEQQATANQRDAEGGRALAAALKADEPAVVQEGGAGGPQGLGVPGVPSGPGRVRLSTSLRDMRASRVSSSHEALSLAQPGRSGCTSRSTTGIGHSISRQRIRSKIGCIFGAIVGAYTSSASSPHSCRWRRYGHQLVANMRGDLGLEVLVNDRACEAHSTYTWAGGGMVLTISTVLPERDLAVELISTYVGHPHTRTIVTHLMLGPPGRTAQIRSIQRAHEDLIRSKARVSARTTTHTS